jgi:hypothetical protein
LGGAGVQQQPRDVIIRFIVNGRDAGDILHLTDLRLGGHAVAQDRNTCGGPILIRSIIDIIFMQLVIPRTGIRIGAVYRVILAGDGITDCLAGDILDEQPGRE